MIASLRAVWNRREFAIHLARSNLKSANASTTLGVVWWLLNPLLLAGVYFFVFGVVFAGAQRGQPAYLRHLLSGLFPFHFTSRALTSGAMSIQRNARLMKNVAFPKLILPMSALLESLFGFGASLVVYLALIPAMTRELPGPAIALLPGVVVIHAFFNLGLAAALAVLTTRVRDTANVLPFVLRIWMYTSPIIWTLDLMSRFPSVVHDVLRINPLFNIIALYRGTLIAGSPVTTEELVLAVGWCVVLALFGLMMFARSEPALSRYL